jgi:hypothetical protein
MDWAPGVRAPPTIGRRCHGEANKGAGGARVLPPRFFPPAARAALPAKPP